VGLFHLRWAVPTRSVSFFYLDGGDGGRYSHFTHSILLLVLQVRKHRMDTDGGLAVDPAAITDLYYGRTEPAREVR
jgi:hypothetical protein